MAVKWLLQVSGVLALAGYVLCESSSKPVTSVLYANWPQTSLLLEAR